jgi:hypothetical protein
VLDGKDLYMFKDIGDMPHIRFTKCNRFIEEYNMRLDYETQQITTKKLIDLLIDPTKKTITSAIQILMSLDKLYDISISMDATYRLYSAAFFWEDEDLTDYDFEIGDEKIRLMKKKKLADFFLNEPINKFLPQMNISAEDIRHFSEYEKELKKLHLQQVSVQNEKRDKTIT